MDQEFTTPDIYVPPCVESSAEDVNDFQGCMRAQEDCVVQIPIH